MFLPIQRFDLETENILEGRPHWTTEKVWPGLIRRLFHIRRLIAM
jgi:hypothetical protein